MLMIKRLSLSRFEAAAQQLVEGSFSRLFGRSLEPIELAHQCLRASEGWPPETFPNQFRITLHPERYASLDGRAAALAADVQRQLEQQLAGQLLAHGPAAASGDLRVLIEPDPQVSTRHVVVTPAYVPSPDEPHHTAVMHREEENAGREAIQAIQDLDAFLIVQGRRHVALDRPVTRIGRRFDNDLVLESNAVSRQHAQIRWRDNFFVLYDVSGRGRTQVNGEATREHVLRPGDVIALSDVMLIYGEGSDPRGNGAPKQELTSSVTLTRDG
jgi:hypothetical protein